MSDINSLNSDLEDIYSLIKEEIKGYVDVSETSLISFKEALLYSSLAKGKMVRPYLCLTWGKILEADFNDCLKLATAIELIHVYSLIHDDLPAMDNDDIRRGKPTLHKQYDEATAILAGDGLQALAFEVLADIKSDNLASILKYFAQVIGINGMVGGQYLDLSFEKKSKVTNDSITMMQSLKTGKLIEFSCVAPTMIVNCNKEVSDSVRSYAHKLGIIFQVRDDFLDKWGNPNTMGKNNQKDKHKGKSSLLDDMSKNEAEILLQDLQSKCLEELNSLTTRYHTNNIVDFTKYVSFRTK